MDKTPWELFYKSFFEKGGYLTALSGLGTTFIIAVTGLLIGTVIGIIITLIKVAPYNGVVSKILRWITEIYVAIFRGTPIIVQLLLVYYVLFPVMGISVNKLFVAIVTFGMNSGAYVSEIIRGGIQSVDSGQMEASRSLGLGYIRAMWHVVLPQAFKNIVPTLGNEFIVLIKETSVVTIIAVMDLTYAFTSIADSTYEYIIPYCVLALTYLVIVVAFTFAVKYVEKRLKKSDRRS